MSRKKLKDSLKYCFLFSSICLCSTTVKNRICKKWSFEAAHDGTESMRHVSFLVSVTLFID